MRVVALGCLAFLVALSLLAGDGPRSSGVFGLADGSMDGERTGSSRRETYTVEVVGTAANVSEWLPQLPLYGGALDGDRVSLTVDESPAVGESWGYNEAGELVRLNLTAYELVVGPGFEGSLFVADEDATGLFFGAGERDYELTIAFHADGTATVRLDAPTW